MATVPMRIALVVDDNGTGIFRYGVAKFIERLQGRAEFALSTVDGPEPQKLVDYTANVKLLTAAIGQLTARPGTNDGGQLLEGIFETAKDLQKRTTRRPGDRRADRRRGRAQHAAGASRARGAAEERRRAPRDCDQQLGAPPDGGGVQAGRAPRREHEPQ